MSAFEEKINEVIRSFKEGNSPLAFRRFADCILDTGDLSRFREFIDFYEWKENNEEDATGVTNKAIEFLERLKKTDIVLDEKQQVLLTAQNIGKTYSRGNFRLSNVTFQIREGEVIGLVGENGNGKTTLLRILSSDLAFDQGEITYGFNNHSSDKYNLRTKLTYIPQRTPKWYGSLKDNLKLTAAHYGIKGNENELWVLIMIIRFGLWKYRNMNWSELSSGYKMRFELARTFLRSPKLLLLDEPLANLDIFAQQTILEDLKFLSKSLRNPLAIVLSSQQLYEVEKISDEVIFLKEGAFKSFNETRTDVAQNGDFVFELETSDSRENLLQALSGLDLKEVQFNGGTYLINISKTDGNEVLKRFTQHDISIKYFRDITNSTRRLFS